VWHGFCEDNPGKRIKTIMSIEAKSIQNNALAQLAQRAGPQTTAAIRTASLKTGVDFAYMMEKAAAESSFDTDAKARTSSASGLYQFIESTWLQMVERYGDRHGLGHYADQIDDRGRVADPALRREILALRNDPELAALMAGEFASENKRSLIANGIPSDKIGPTELYLAHFLGAGAAGEFIKSMHENPLTAAADIFPRAAKANKNVFYNANTQQAKSLGDVYAFFDKKFQSGPVSNDAVMVAQVTPRATPIQKRPEQNEDSIQSPRLSMEMMAYLNGAKPAYQAMQEDAVKLISQNSMATQAALNSYKKIMAPNPDDMRQMLSLSQSGRMAQSYFAASPATIAQR
jgi:hypothetical protein